MPPVPPCPRAPVPPCPPLCADCPRCKMKTDSLASTLPRDTQPPPTDTAASRGGKVTALAARLLAEEGRQPAAEDHGGVGLESSSSLEVQKRPSRISPLRA